MSGEALKGHLDLLLLAVVGPRASHGYAILSALRERSGGQFDLPEGTIYPALHRLERADLLRSRWVVERGRRRRVYERTERGRKALADRKSEWGRFSAAVTRVAGGSR